ncbi:MAG: hypothetical protein U0521_07985 [Anaerolineae bacterium]
MTPNLIDRILYNGHIRTLDDARPVVSALAISRERVVATGSDDEIRAHCRSGDDPARPEQAVCRPV